MSARLEPFWLPRPPLSRDVPDVAVDAFHAERVLPARGGWIANDLPLPSWELLCRLADRTGVLLHGSAELDIDTFEPRTPNDRSPDDFSKQRAVFAAGDGIWALFYAVLDRDRPGMRFLNAALRFETEADGFGPTRYFFSVAEGVLEPPPWRTGTIYLLPREGFVQQPPYHLRGRRVLEPHWASPAPVRPLAKLRVEPRDFPFLERVRAHDPRTVDARAARDPEGFPWLEG